MGASKPQPAGITGGRLRHRPRSTVSLPAVAVNDERLSFRARGVLLYLLAKPDGWDVRSEAIARDGKEGREAVRAALRELMEAGYYRNFRIRYGGGGGKFYTVTELKDTPGPWGDEQEQGSWYDDASGSWQPPSTSAPAESTPTPAAVLDASSAPGASSRSAAVPGDGFPGAGNPDAGNLGAHSLPESEVLPPTPSAEGASRCPAHAHHRGELPPCRACGTSPRQLSTDSRISR